MAGEYRRPHTAPYRVSDAVHRDPPLTRGGHSVFDDPEAFRLRFLLSQAMGPPLALRGPKLRYAPAAQRQRRGGR